MLIGCTNHPLKVDVSNVQVPETHINRLDRDVFEMDTTNVLKQTEALNKKYGLFFKVFCAGILNSGVVRDTNYSGKLKRFIADRDMRAAYNDCKQQYNDIQFLENDFTDAARHFKYYFPKRGIPKVVAMFTGFNYNITPVDSTIGVGLDMYLGSNNKFYDMLAFPKYKSRWMTKECIMPDAVRQWLLTQFPYNMKANDFVSQIIYFGKIMYLTDALLPEVADTLKLQYTPRQLRYCTVNEFNMWNYFIAQKVLYTTDQAEIMKFTAEGPFTSAFNKEAPSRVGYWMGYRIVKQYMEKNPNITLEQLMSETDGQQLLMKSKYKPAK